MKLVSKKPPSAMYPKELNTLGDHIRARRLNLGLLQKDVAEIIGVTTDTITNWDKNRLDPTAPYKKPYSFKDPVDIELIGAGKISGRCCANRDLD